MNNLYEKKISMKTNVKKKIKFSIREGGFGNLINLSMQNDFAAEKQ